MVAGATLTLRDSAPVTFLYQELGRGELATLIGTACPAPSLARTPRRPCTPLSAGGSDWCRPRGERTASRSTLDRSLACLTVPSPTCWSAFLKLTAATALIILLSRHRAAATQARRSGNRAISAMSETHGRSNHTAETRCRPMAFVPGRVPRCARRSCCTCGGARRLRAVWQRSLWHTDDGAPRRRWDCSSVPGPTCRFPLRSRNPIAATVRRSLRRSRRS